MILALLIAAPAWAQTAPGSDSTAGTAWYRSSDLTNGSGCGNTLDGGKTCYFRFATDALHSRPLELKGHYGHSVCYVELDVDGLGAGTVDLWFCNEDRATCDRHGSVLIASLTGDYTVTPNKACAWSVPAGLIWAEPVVSPATPSNVFVRAN
jgi:hypothetical protein